MNSPLTNPMAEKKVSAKKKADKVEGQSLEPVVTTLKELSDLDKIKAEIAELKPRLAETKDTDREAYGPMYRRFMWLIEQRDLIEKQQS